MAIFRFDPNKPGKKEAKLFSNVDLSEDFVARIWGLLDILKVTNYKDQKYLNDAILTILMECLLPAHISLENIRKHTPGMAELDKQKDYIDLHNHLWAAYKDRMPKVFENTNFNIGFLFQKDALFEKGIVQLTSDYPTLTKDFINQIIEDRNTWQKDMVMIRNDFIQHKKIDPEIVDTFFTPENSEIIFDNIWISIEQIILNFLVQELHSRIKIVEVPKPQRDPKMPKKYILSI